MEIYVVPYIEKSPTRIPSDEHHDIIKTTPGLHRCSKVHNRSEKSVDN